MPVAQVLNSLLKRLEFGIRLLLTLLLTVVQVKQRIIKATFKSCELLARLLAYLLHVAACGAILRVVGAAGVARSASPRHHGNTRVMGGMVFLPCLTRTIQLNLEIQVESKADRAHNTHTKLMVDRKSSGKPNEKTKRKGYVKSGKTPKEKVSKGRIHR